MIQSLLNIGFTLNEAKAYLSYLENGDSTAAEIARKLDLDKPTVYRATESLTKKGLILANVKKKGTTYSTLPLEKLKDIYEEEKRKLEAQGSEISNLIEELKNNANSKRQTYIKVEKGMEAHLNSMEDSLKNNKEKMIYEKWEMNNPIFLEETYSAYVRKFVKKRVELGISCKSLRDEDIALRHSELLRTSKKILKEMRVYSPELNDKSSFRLYDNTVEIISFEENNDFIVVTIKDKYIASLMKTMFNFIWNRSEIYNVTD